MYVSSIQYFTLAFLAIDRHAMNFDIKSKKGNYFQGIKFSDFHTSKN